MSNCICETIRQLPDGSWGPAKPLEGPFIWMVKRRIKAAWLVLRGKAGVVKWY